jgi:electron transfer flavoprotein alpha/beta subunit
MLKKNDQEKHMKILVCIKQVPDMESSFKVNSEGVWYVEQDLAFRMNEYDEFAVEQAVRVKEQLGALVDISILSIGPDRVVEVIKKGLAMGGDGCAYQGCERIPEGSLAGGIHDRGICPQ